LVCWSTSGNAKRVEDKRMSKKAALLLVLVVLAPSWLVTTLSVKADSHTIVVPDDYPYISSAIGNATDGDTISVRSGTYEEQVLVINKSLSLKGENIDNTKIILHPPSQPLFGSSLMVYDNPIQINANHVVLSGFTIAADGGSISAEGTNLQIKSNYLKTPVSVTGNETQIIDNRVGRSNIAVRGANNSILQNTLDGGGITCDGSFNRVLNNIITREQLRNETGIILSGSSNLIFNNSVINDGIFLKGNSNYNFIGRNNCSSLLISRSYNNTVFGNYVSGILGFLGSHNVFYRNYMQGILLGNQYMDAPDNTFYENNFDFTGGKKILIYTGVLSSLSFDNGKVGNYWSDYLTQYPYAKGSNWGIGDTPYVVYLALENNLSPFTYGFSDKSNYEITLTDRYPLMSPSNISSVQLQLPEWANTAVSSSDSNNQSSPTSSPSDAEPFPLIAVVIASVITVAVVGAGLLVYFKKRKR
jgi:hypothetical protein